MSGTDGVSHRSEPLCFSVTAPANLLLMGEYAVLEEGGLGVAIAPDVRASGSCTVTTALMTTAATQTASRKPRMSVTGELPGGAVHWSAALTGRNAQSDRAVAPAAGDLLVRACEHLDAIYGGAGSPGRSAEVELDSSAFFTADGRKRGLGSSAAIVVVLTALWQRASANDPERHVAAAEEVFERALAAHRAGQGGSGSGYDVACSAFGGTVLFSGGSVPSVRPVSLPWLPPVRVIQGAKAVSTVSSVGAYRKWKAANPAHAKRFLDESNRLVSTFVQATGWELAAQVLREYRDLAGGLGAAIGIDASVTTPSWANTSDVVVKAVGAGNELAVAIGRIGADDPETGAVPEPTAISQQGLAWA